MPKSISAKQLASITNGRILEDFDLVSLCMDTRTLKNSDVFIPLIGENFDAHSFINEDLESKVSGIIVSEEFYKTYTGNFKNFLIVKDTYQALLDIANFRRLNFKGKTIGITGSVGKTTMKDMLQNTLSADFKVFSTLGNYNNHIGLPFCMAHLDNSYDIAIFEMGMSSKGEISFLTNMVKPDIAIITAITEAHIEFFDSIWGIVDAKLEILESLSKEACFIVDKNTVFTDYMIDKAKNQGISNIVYFNSDELSANDIKILDLNVHFESSSNFGCSVKANILNKQCDYILKTIYSHNVSLSAIAMFCALYWGGNINNITNAIGKFEVPSGRGNIICLTYNNNSVILINDSYNANYTSMSASILSSNLIKSSKKIFILGEMIELGTRTLHAHLDLKDVIFKIEYKMLILVGTNMKALYEDIKQLKNVCYFDDYTNVYDKLCENLENDDVVLIKGSKGSNVYKIADKLTLYKTD